MKRVGLAIQGTLIALFAILVIMILGKMVTYEDTKKFFYALIILNATVNPLILFLLKKEKKTS
ncbi:MAG: hypothetical protein QMB63_00830 [Clostridiaceae bacterium]